MGPRSDDPRKTVVRLRWRDYETPSGRRPVREFIDELSDKDFSVVIGAMRDVRLRGLEVARHLRGDIYEVRADGVDQAFRVLFAQEGNKGRILLALEATSKKTQRTPQRSILLAEKRLASWRRPGHSGRE